MIGEYIDLSVGMLLVADKSFTVNRNRPNDSFTEKARIKKGKVIELRYQYDWNFRTECNTYCNAPAKVLIKNCSFLGRVHDDVKRANNTNLKDILSNDLYHGKSEFKLVRK